MHEDVFRNVYLKYTWRELEKLSFQAPPKIDPSQLFTNRSLFMAVLACVLDEVQKSIPPKPNQPASDASSAKRNASTGKTSNSASKPSSADYKQTDGTSLASSTKSDSKKTVSIISSEKLAQLKKVKAEIALDSEAKIFLEDRYNKLKSDFEQLKLQVTSFSIAFWYP